MLVVADATPLNILVRIECAAILGELFKSVIIPPEVLAELTHPRTPDVVREFVTSPPSWLGVQPAITHRRLPPLDSGEEAAINLACDLKAASILIDDKEGRRIASRMGLLVTGTLGVLELASQRNLIQLPIVAESLAKTDFRIDPELIEQALHREAGRRSQTG